MSSTQANKTVQQKVNFGYLTVIPESGEIPMTAMHINELSIEEPKVYPNKIARANRVIPVLEGAPFTQNPVVGVPLKETIVVNCSCIVC